MSLQVVGEVSKEVIEFNWEIHVDCFKDKLNGDFVVSPVFGHLNHKENQSNWQLNLYPKGAAKSCQGFLSLFLENLSKSVIKTNFSLSLLNQNNVKVDDF